MRIRSTTILTTLLGLAHASISLQKVKHKSTNIKIILGALEPGLDKHIGSSKRDLWTIPSGRHWSHNRCNLHTMRTKDDKHWGMHIGYESRFQKRLACSGRLFRQLDRLLERLCHLFWLQILQRIHWISLEECLLSGLDAKHKALRAFLRLGRLQLDLDNGKW